MANDCNQIIIFMHNYRYLLFRSSPEIQLSAECVPQVRKLWVLHLIDFRLRLRQTGIGPFEL